MKAYGHSFALILLTVLALVTVILTLPYKLSSQTSLVTEITAVSLTVNGETTDITLPLTLKDLPHGTKAVLSFTVPDASGDLLFFGSVYAPLTIETNGHLVYKYGSEGTYPSFFSDPPTHYDSVRFPHGTDTLVQMTYISPNDRRSLSIHAPIVGNGTGVLYYLMARYGLTMTIALFFIILGILLTGISLLFVRPDSRNKQYFSFVYPGLLFLFSGAWQFGENPLSVYLSQQPSLLYVLDFMGMFLLMIPLYRMGMTYLDLKSSRLLNAGLIILYVSVLITVLLQLTGTVGFHRSLFYYHFLLPLALIVLTGKALAEYLKYGHRMTGIFFGTFLILAAAALLELLNYHIGFFPQYSALFQLGLFLFVIAMAVFTTAYTRDLYAMQMKALSLENEVKIQEETITAQTTRNELLLSHFEEIRRQRHDIRHHLRTINEMLQCGEIENASNYIQSVTASVPAYTPESFCSNQTLNATLSFYAQQIRDAGIDLNIHVQVPAANPNISDANLCVIFGNLMENALEACQRMKVGSCYIHLTAQVRGETLFITMDNSYDGNVRTSEGKYYSSKRQGFGTGLRSIKALAEDHNGSASFCGRESMFRSEVSVRL